MVLTVEVAGEVYNATSNYSISQQAGGVSNSTIDILVGSTQDVPRALSAVQIKVDTVPFFFGIIQNIQSPPFSSGYETRLYRLSLNSGEVLFNNHLVSEAYEGKYTHEIVDDLFDKYIEDDGLTLGDISNTSQYYEYYNISYRYLSKVLAELADDVNASFNVSADKKFYFLTRDDFTQVDVPDKIKNLQIREEAGDLRTFQIVTGAKEETASQTEEVTWLADQTVFPLGYPIKSITSVKINGGAVDVGILGLDEDDTDVTFLYNVSTKQLSLNSNATTKPVATDTVQCIYIGYYEVTIEKGNESVQQEIAALNGTSGVIDNLINDETLEDLADAELKAAAMLDLYGEREQVITCNCLDIDASELLNIWTFSEPDLGIEGQYIITERNIASFTEDLFMLNVTLNSKNYTRRYGTVLNPDIKTVGKETRVDKSTSLGDTINVMDTADVDLAGLAFYPTANDTDYLDPLFQDSFYPMGN